eukprot:PhM_4_TR18873/c2_g1_i1/m.82957
MHSDSTSDSNNNTNPDNNKPITEYKLFDSGVTTHYRLPSAAVHPTQGLEQYARHERTPHWLKKQRAEETGDKHPAVFTLCNAYQQGRCGRGTACRYVHADLAHPDAVATPVHSVKCATPYCLPAGTAVPVVDRATGTSATHRSERVLVTKGSDDWHTTTPAARRRIFHCKHFHEEGMCLRGSDCVFLHVLPRDDDEEENDDDDAQHEAQHPDSVSDCDSSVSSSCRTSQSFGHISATTEQSPATSCAELPSFCDASASSSASSSCGGKVMANTSKTEKIMSTYRHDPYGARVLLDEGYLYSYAPMMISSPPAVV